MKLVTCIGYATGQRLTLPNFRRHTHTFSSNPAKVYEAIDPQEATKAVDTMFCEDQDVDAVIEYMSTYHPGVDIVVYDAISAHIRTPGPLKAKSITKDGVLPV